MAKECKKCKAPVTESTKVCPQCGVANPGVTLKEALAGLVVLVFVGWVVLSLAGGIGKGPSAGEGGDDAQPVPASLSPLATASVPPMERVAPTSDEVSDYVRRVDNAIDDRFGTLGKETGATLRDANIRMDGLLAKSMHWPADHPCSIAADDAMHVWLEAKGMRAAGSGGSQEYENVRKRYAASRERCLSILDPVADPVLPTARETRDYISQLDDLATPDAQVRALADGSVLLRNYNIRLYALAHQGDERWPLLHDCRLAGWDAVSLWEQAKLRASEPERASRQDEYTDAVERYKQHHDACLAGATE